MRNEYNVVVITSDGDELEDQCIEGETTQEAAEQAFDWMGRDCVETIWVSNADNPADRASYQQHGSELVQD